MLRSRQRDQDQPFPYIQLGTLALCRLAEPIALVSILPYAYPMVKHFRFGEPLEAAFWSGILVSSFSICEAAVCPFWGALSDRIGRKPVLLVGMFGTMISMLLIGFASNYWFALTARCVGGILNGNIGVIQTIVGESCPNPEHQPRAFAFMPTVWLLGTIIGPSIGAFGVGRIWPERPYLLPNLICAIILCTAITAGALLLKETNPIMINQQRGDDSYETNSVKTVTSAIRSYGTFSRNLSEETLVGSGTEDSGLAKGEVNKTEVKLRHEFEDEESGPTFTSRILLLCGALALFSYHNMCFDHLFPILLLDSRPIDHTPFPAGGLGFTQQQVGLIMSVHGMLALMIQIFIMPPLTNRVGVFRLFQLSVLLHPFVYLLPALMPALPTNPTWMLCSVMFLELLVFNLAAIVLYPLLLILIKDAAPRPSVLGRINGVAASCGAFARALAPPAAGWFHGVGERYHIPGLAWYSTAIVAVLACLQMMTIKRGGTEQKGGNDGDECVDCVDDRPVWLLGDENVIISDDEDDENEDENHQARRQGEEHEERSFCPWQDYCGP